MSVIDTRYGNGVLEDELDRAAPYILVTDPVPLEIYQESLVIPPAQILIADTIEHAHVRELAARAGGDLRIVGLGGGTVMDAAKYVAHVANSDLVLVPTITSTNAQFSDFISIREDGVPVGLRVNDLDRRIVIDFVLIRSADPRLNRAGFGDLLALETALMDARIAAEAGRIGHINQGVEQRAVVVVKHALEAALQVGVVSNEGIKRMMELFAEATSIMSSEPALAAGTEHLLAWNLERVTARHFIHGETVALGVVIAAHKQDGRVDQLIAALDDARVRWRPHELKISYEEFSQMLQTVGEYNRRSRNIASVFDDHDPTSAEVAALWREITT